MQAASERHSAAARDAIGLKVEDRLIELAHACGPLRRVLAVLAASFMKRRAWETLGYARIGDYARERLGISPRMLQEFARVDGCLVQLPELEGALVSGGLPWSKVRLLARVASAENEAELIELARHTSVRALERSLRCVDVGASGALKQPTDEEGASVESRECVALSVPMRVAFLWHRTRDQAAKQAGETTPPARVLEWVTAEVGSWLGAPHSDEEPSGRDAAESRSLDLPPQQGPRARPELAASGPRAYVASSVEIPAFLKPHIASLDAASPHELDARLRRVQRLEQRLDAEIAQLLRCVTSAEYEWRGRYQTRDQFARECLGMSPRKARALVSLDRAGDRCPELRRAFRDGSLSWVQAQVVARLVTKGEAHNEGLDRWVVWAQSVTVRELEEAVERAQLVRDTDPARWEALRDEPERFASVAVPPVDERQVCSHSTGVEWPVRIRLAAPGDVARLFRRALCAVRLAIERATGCLPSEGAAFEAMICHALDAWQVEDPWLRERARRAKREYAVFDRDGWRCVVPGCTSRRSLQAHHIVFRSAGGSDNEENLTTLCAFHHLRGVHSGRVRITGAAPDALCFELGVRDGGPPLVRYRSGDRLVGT